MARNVAQQRFLRERALALAVVHLTRRKDLIVTEETADIGVDLWVTLDRKDRGSHRKFGVELRGLPPATTAEGARKSLSLSMNSHSLKYGPFPFPVVLFFFTTENSEGWFTWLAEPVVTSAHEFKLAYHSEATCRPLNCKAVDEIVEAVDRWYDAFFKRATRGNSGEKRSRSTVS